MDLSNASVSLRVFNQGDGHLISNWIVDPDYAYYFRNNMAIPTLDECMNYPAWSQNIIMMLEANDGQQSYTIGMVSAYHCNYRNMVVKAGILIDKQVRNQQTSSRCMEMWVEYLFNHCNFRKVVCEIIEDRLAQPLLDRGFVEEGRYRQEVCVDRNYTDEIRLACLSKDFHLKLAPKKKTTVKLVKVDGGQS